MALEFDPTHEDSAFVAEKISFEMDSFLHWSNFLNFYILCRIDVHGWKMIIFENFTLFDSFKHITGLSVHRIIYFIDASTLHWRHSWGQANHKILW